MIDNIQLSLLITLAIALPDMILGHWLKLLTSRISVSTFVFLFIISFSVSFVEQPWIMSSFFVLFYIFQLVQVNGWLYFGKPIDPDNISRIAFEGREIFLSGIGAYYRLWKGWLTLFINLILWIFIYNHLDFFTNRTTTSLAFLYPLIFFISFPFLIFIQGTKFHRASEKRSVFHHSLRSFSLWIVYTFLTKSNLPEYKPYTKVSTESFQDQIILIMGESITCRHLSLFGYHFPTTPFLDSLKNNPRFSFARGISSSISTIISFAYFFNIVREYSNLERLKKRDFNLFKLAQEKGYKTVCISAQETSLFLEAGIEFIDHLIIVKNDEAIIDEVLKLKSEGKIFLVLNNRNVHSPYEKFHTIPASFEIENRLIDSYAKALLYHDDWIKKIALTIEKTFNRDTVLLFTSDHGEMLGENNMYGHTLLDKYVGEVPVWAIADEKHFIHDWIREQGYISHYELGCQIAKMMGFTILNPNDDGKTYYLSGTNILRSGYIEYQKSKDHIIFSEPTGKDFEANFTVLKVLFRKWYAKRKGKPII
jgi:glucan phosphoethanolaminetransferase (alkaline phosphatase superfamily)